MTQTSPNKSGGILIGLIVMMVAVGILGAGLARSLQGQAVTAVQAYNQMRARYAADSGKNLLKWYANSNNTDVLDAYALAGTTTFTLANGDQFTIEILKNGAVYESTIIGQHMSGATVSANRRLVWHFSLGGGGTTPDGETPAPTGETGTALTDTGPLTDADVSGTVLPDEAQNNPINLMPPGQGNWRKTYNNLLNLHNAFVVDTLPIRGWGNRTSLKLKTDLDIRYAEADSADSNHMIWNVALPFNYLTQAASARSANNGYLAYEAQVKISWQFDGSDYNRVTGAQGLAFKLHGTSSADYQFYAVTIMRYLSTSETANMITSYNELDRNVIDGYNDTDGYWGTYDCIANDIKPPGKANRYLLVLWKQWLDGNGNLQRGWVAYQDLQAANDFIKEWGGMRDATIHLRVTEGADSGGEFIDVQMYLGDALSWNFGAGWVSHTSPYDRRWKRYPYANASESGSPFVTWPALDLTDWAKAVDYYTVTEATDSVSVNGSATTLLNDGITFRLYDSAYLSKNQSNPLGDIGLIFCGNFLTGMDHSALQNNGKLKARSSYQTADIPNLYMAADDFALRWLTTSGGSSGSSGVDIITDF